MVFLAQIGVLIEDKEFIGSYMNGKPWKAGKFAFSLRLSLWAEHLGLHVGEVSGFNFLHFLIAMFDLYLIRLKEIVILHIVNM